MKPLILIPARAGSKRLPGKNLQKIGDTTLVEWAITAAQEAMDCRIIVSSDSSDVLNISSEHRVDCHFRNPEISTDDTPSIEVVRQVFRDQGDGGGAGWGPHNAVILLQPTSPFRIAADITGAWELYLDRKGDAVVSVSDGITGGDWLYEIGHADRLRPIRQTKNLYVPNGAIFILSREAIGAHLDWWTGITYAYRMPLNRSIDIDTQADLDMARAIYARG